MTIEATRRAATKEARAFPGRMILTFLICATVCGLLIGSAISHKQKNVTMNMEQLITEKGVQIHDAITRLLYKTQALAALVIQGDGEVENFDKIANTIIDDPAIINILIAPGGVVSNVYPITNNERVIGYDLLGPGAGNLEAIHAKELGQLVFGGPFRLVQGGEALVGRLPVYLDGADGDKRFWGLVSVTLRYPDALNAVNLESLEREGLAYELWRINPDDSSRQIIASSGYRYNNTTAFIEKTIKILNAEWSIRILPVRTWYEYFDNWALIGMGLMLSGLATRLVENNYELRKVKAKLENLVRTDSLTGVMNRTGLFQAMEDLVDRDHRFQVWYVDLNYFKQVNDTFGHTIGDLILTHFATVMRRHLDSRHVLGRISGDEFVLLWKEPLPLASDTEHFWKTIDSEFCDSIFTVNGNEIMLSFARGLSYYPDDGESIDLVISCADRRMYVNKNMQYSANTAKPATGNIASGT